MASEVRLIIGANGETLYREKIDAHGTVVSWDSGAELREAELMAWEADCRARDESAQVLDQRRVKVRKARSCDRCGAPVRPGDDATVTTMREAGTLVRETWCASCTGGEETYGARGLWSESDERWREELPGMGSGSPDAL